MTNPASGSWNSGANWSGGSAPTGVATFDSSNTTAISLSVDPFVSITGIVFNSGASAYTISSSASFNHPLYITGQGITNSSGSTQAFSIGVLSGIIFSNTSTAGSNIEFNNRGPSTTLTPGGFVQFENSSTAGSSTFINNSATIANSGTGTTSFYNTSTAGSGRFFNNGATVSGASGGSTVFTDTANSGSGTFINDGGT